MAFSRQLQSEKKIFLTMCKNTKRNFTFYQTETLKVSMKTVIFSGRIRAISLFLALCLPIVCEPQENGLLPKSPLIVELVEAFPEAPEPQMYNILTDVPDKGMSLLDKIVLLDSWICNGDCYESYPTRYSPRRYPMCQTCHCDIMCQFYRDCCPGVQLKQNITYHEEPLKVSGCVIKTAVVYNLSNLKYNDYQTMITRCPSVDGSAGYISKEDQEKCEHAHIQDQEQSQPVSSPISGFTYRNIFCARCHNDSHNLDPWPASVSCIYSAESLISTTRSREELYSKLVNQTSVKDTMCELEYKLPNPSSDLDETRTLGGTYMRFCTQVFPPLIDTCNVSGLLVARDPELERACAMYESVFDGKYRNMFCYLCNQPYPVSLQEFEMMVMTPLGSNPARLDFTALLDFGDREVRNTQSEMEKVEDVQCNTTQYYDIDTCECRQLECSEGKYLNKEGSCRSLIETDMLGYRACQRLDISSKIPIKMVDVSMMEFQFSQAVLSLAKQHTGHVLEYCPDALNISFYFEDFFSAIGTLEELEERVNSSRETYLSEVREILGPSTNTRITTEYPCAEMSGPKIQCLSDPRFSINKSHREGLIRIGERTDVYYIGFSDTSHCAFVSLNKANFSFNEANGTVVFTPTGDQLPSNAISIGLSPDTAQETVRMCAYNYEELTITNSFCQLKNHDLDFDSWTISGIISIVSTVISLICLALTFIVYLILKPLRIGGGKNIMVLTVLLFIAQTFYEFGMEQSENQDFCRAIGLMVHYTWLAAVFSMNACTVERFLKLCFPLKSRSFFLSEKKPFMLATIYALLCPLVIVSGNIAANIVSDGDIGYGHPRICYINSRSSRIYAFALPMGVVLVTNLIFLGFTLWTLRKSSEATTAGNSGVRGGTTNANTIKNNKVGLLGCARLSVVTGTMWLLIFLYEAIQSQVLSYVVTALIGLQGLVFFLSMVVNKRVIRMLKIKAAESSSGTGTGTTSSGTDSTNAKHHVSHKTNTTGSKQQLLSNCKTNNATSQELSTSKDNTQTTCISNQGTADSKT